MELLTGDEKVKFVSRISRVERKNVFARQLTRVEALEIEAEKAAATVERMKNPNRKFRAP